MKTKNNNLCSPSPFLTDDPINHPKHYGGDTTYEAIKVIEAWDLNFHLGNVVKYISRAGKKNPKETLTDLKKAQWYLERYLEEYQTVKIKKLGISNEKRITR